MPAIRQLLYASAKKCVDALPPWLLRARPFGVYAIDLSAGSSSPKSETNEAISWITNRSDLHEIAPLADECNLKAWDGQRRRAIVTHREGRPIAVAWIATDSFEEPDLGLRFELKSDEAWLYAAVVARPWRRQGVYRRLLQACVAELSTEGRQRLLLGVTAGNEPSRRAHAAVGAESIGGITAIRLLGATACRTSGAVCFTDGRRTTIGQRLDLAIA